MKNKLVTPVLSVLGLLVVIAWMANLFSDRVQPGLVPQPVAQEGEAVTVQTRMITPSEPVPGTIIARQATDISSRILARIERILVRAGDTVRKGDLLIELEKSDLISRQSQAAEQIRKIEARLTEADLQNARIEELFQEGMVARQELDTSRATLASLKAELSGARQRLKEMESTLSFSLITAPISGRIVDRYAEPGDTATPGKTLLSLYNPLSLRVEANVREKLALSLQIGDDVTVQIPTLGQTLTGTVEEIVPAANIGARSFRIHVLMNYSSGLLPGMFARLLFDLEPEKRLLIPRSRIASVGQLDIVRVLTDRGNEKRIITLGKEHGELVEVRSGLSADDRILPIR